MNALTARPSRSFLGNLNPLALIAVIPTIGVAVWLLATTQPLPAPALDNDTESGVPTVYEIAKR